MKQARTQRGGFTIVEVVMALGILLVGMTSVLGLLAFGASMSRTAQLRNAAASAAGNELPAIAWAWTSRMAKLKGDWRG